jgi:hypothetical protein
MRRITIFFSRLPLLSAILAAGLASAAMNASFGWHLGGALTSAVTLATLFISLDVAKWFMLSLAASAAKRRALLRVVACLAIWSVAVCSSLASAVGFSATLRDKLVSGTAGRNGQIVAARGVLARLRDDLRTAKRNRRWRTTNGCSPGGATERLSIVFCKSIDGIRADIGRAEQILLTGVVETPDPQSELISKVTGYGQENIRIGLATALAVVAETISALGFFAVGGQPVVRRPVAKYKTKKRPRRRRSRAKVVDLSKVRVTRATRLRGLNRANVANDT